MPYCAAALPLWASGCQNWRAVPKSPRRTAAQPSSSAQAPAQPISHSTTATAANWILMLASTSLVIGPPRPGHVFLARSGGKNLQERVFIGFDSAVRQDAHVGAGNGPNGCANSIFEESRIAG